MSDEFRLHAKVTIDYQGNVMSVLVTDGQEFYDSSLHLYVGRDGIEVEEVD